MTVTIINDSSWIEDVLLQKDGEDEVFSGTSFIVHFNPSIAMATLTEDHFKIYDVGEEAYLDSPWMGIIPERDYSFLNRVLSLYLQDPLETSHQYYFIIVGLEDGAGAPMGGEYTLQFDTSPTPSPVEFRLDEEPIFLEDYSVATLDDTIPSGTGSSSFYVVETSPPDGSILVDVDETSIITITLSADVADVSLDDFITVERMTIDNLWHPWVEIDDLTIEVSADTINIAFPLDATPEDHYLEVNSEYRVRVSADLASADATPVLLGEEYSFNFLTELQPLYYNPYDMQTKFPEMSISEIAIFIYKSSLEARRFASTLPLSPEDMSELPYAAQEYVRCRSLFLIYTTHEEQVTRMELADLMIASEGSLVDDLLACAERWQFILENLGASGMKAFTKSYGRITMPEQSSDRIGSHVRDRNTWW